MGFFSPAKPTSTHTYCKKAIRVSRCRFGGINISPANFTSMKKKIPPNLHLLTLIVKKCSWRCSAMVSMSLAFFSGGSNSYFLLCVAASIDLVWPFRWEERDSQCFLCSAAFIVNTWAFWSGERDLRCLCCAAVLFFTNMSLSSGERDSYFSLCASASVSKILTFFSGGRVSLHLSTHT